MTNYNPRFDFAFFVRFGVSPYMHDEVPEPCEMTTAEELAANDAWLAYRLRRWCELIPDYASVERARGITAQIEQEWFGECEHES